MIIHKKGNLLDMAEAGEFDVVVHGCNCFNTMGGGIAREIARRYPNAPAIDAATKKGDYNKLGNWSLVTMPGKKFVIINAYTQYNMSNGGDVFEYVAFELILQKLSKMYGDLRFGFPYIGMGLAKGDPEIIIPMLERFSYHVNKQGGSATLVEFG